MSCVSVVFEETIICRPIIRAPQVFRGDYITLRNAKLYSDALIRRPIKYLSGRFCVFSDKHVGDRIRITDSPSGVHSVDRIIGWISLRDIKEVIR